MRSASEWAQVKTMAANGIPQREIARRLEINRRTVARLLTSQEPPRYRRELWPPMFWLIGDTVRRREERLARPRGLVGTLRR